MSAPGCSPRTSGEYETLILDALARPLSAREVRLIVGKYDAVARALEGLIEAGRVIRHGVRRSVRYGPEVVYVKGAEGAKP
jgi:hypothetical protein